MQGTLQQCMFVRRRGCCCRCKQSGSAESLSLFATLSRLHFLLYNPGETGPHLGQAISFWCGLLLHDLLLALRLFVHQLLLLNDGKDLRYRRATGMRLGHSSSDGQDGRQLMSAYCAEVFLQSMFLLHFGASSQLNLYAFWTTMSSSDHQHQSTIPDHDDDK